MCHLDHHRKFSYKDYWMCDLDSDVAGSSKDTQRIQPKPKTQLSSTGRPVCGQESTKEIEKGILFGHDTFSQEKHDEVTDSTSSGRPECGPESTKRCVLTPKHVENDQTSTGRPVLVDQKEEHKIDFRVPGLSHVVVKEAVEEFFLARGPSSSAEVRGPCYPRHQGSRKCKAAGRAGLNIIISKSVIVNRSA